MINPKLTILRKELIYEELDAVVAAMSYDMAEAMVKERESRYGE